MKSSVCNLDSSSATAEALKQAEAFASLCGLSEKNALHLRLLAEELLGMATGTLELHDVTFSIESEQTKFRLCLSARAEVSEQAKTRLLNASSAGENALYKGVTGKLRQAIDFLLVDPSFGAGMMGEPFGLYDGMTSSEVGMLMGESLGLYGGMVSSTQNTEWSLEYYRRCVAREEKAQAWDELEKSILGKLADDVRIGVRSNQVEIVIDKIF